MLVDDGCSDSDDKMYKTNYSTQMIVSQSNIQKTQCFHKVRAKSNPLVHIINKSKPHVI